MSEIEPDQAPDAPLGRADATRRWSVVVDGERLFPGLTKPEAQDAASALQGVGASEAPRCAFPVELPALLSDGAGPHLLGADGALALALGPHPHLAEFRVAMSEPTPRHRVGLVAPDGAGPLWRWVVEAQVAPADQVAALDGLAAAQSVAEASAWALRRQDDSG